MPYSCSGDMRRAAGWVGSSSAVVDGVVYQGPVDGYGYALDASTGELR
jgi:outer membrane protein assembly factor BamB